MERALHEHVKNARKLREVIMFHISVAICVSIVTMNGEKSVKIMKMKKYWILKKSENYGKIGWMAKLMRL
jgi:hypothetical protein